MLRKEQNDLLTRTGPGTSMGGMFRRYWTPALLADELPENDCPPVRVRLLSEKLIAFRDTEGRYGLMDEFCAHRGVSLWFGRNEECGLRCPYHGWKYDVTGQCVEIPSEPEKSGFRAMIKLRSYRWSSAAACCGPTWDRPSISPDCRNSSSPWCRRSRPIRRSGCNTAIGFRRWRAASIPVMCHGCIVTRCAQIR
jgi:nitrite reductase/ring-hydroxylating ferredoxin subunit